ncbi:hypothetical protein [Streptomyces parvulus]|uniref:hypothetical protein n=1 Tax=Streptomyces parvulus TaxID=146923 RepID=UPI0013314B94|nr:hypothetical protein [Streptomyces parvulus]
MGVGDLENFLSSPAAQSVSGQTWEAIRERAVGGMQNPVLPADVRLRWSALAISAVRGKSTAESMDSRVSAAAEVHVRSYVICEFGRVDDGNLQDLESLTRLVFHAIGMSREQVAASAADWRNSGRAEMLTLRRIKNLVTPLKEVVHLFEPGDPRRAEVEDWLALTSRLP